MNARILLEQTEERHFISAGLGAMSMLAWASINRMHEIETNIQNKINWEMESIQDLMESFDHWEPVVPKSWISQLC